MTTNDHKSLIELPLSETMPFLFVGHGNPMNAILDTEYGREWTRIGATVPRPNAILCISAHWLTPGSTQVTAMDLPKTIHDFGGFPQELFDAQYPVPGAPDYARKTIELIRKTEVIEDFRWGLDHGTWSVLMKMFPNADIPVYQLSMDYSREPQYHFDLAKQLSELRNHGVLIVGSGNLVHNLQRLGAGGDWATEFDEMMKGYMDDGDQQSVVDFLKMGPIARLAHPTHEHFLPLLYSLGLRTEKDEITYFNESIDFGSISMRSVLATPIS
ncbi:4,5-DOPA dioxygenase extradiol [Dehalococcoides mccartyi]|nr:4,5-DOPA dioxygenase extradiol [Dehalococcoides mccartyi]